MSKEGWIGVDLDGTLAYDHGWKGPEHIGDPIPEMEKRVKDWIAQGKTVKIFTARAAQPEYIPIVKNWLRENDFGDLEVTCHKDMMMIELWDDRAIQVMPNTGKPVGEAVEESFSLFKQLREEIDQANKKAKLYD